MALALQLIGEHTYRDLVILNKLRNDFAHKIEMGGHNDLVTFQNSSISARCRNLWLPKRPEVEAWVALLHPEFRPDLKSARGLFLWTAGHIGLLLTSQLRRPNEPYFSPI
jgi:hypothetical protein